MELVGLPGERLHTSARPARGDRDDRTKEPIMTTLDEAIEALTRPVLIYGDD